LRGNHGANRIRKQRDGLPYLKIMMVIVVLVLLGLAGLAMNRY
jgi:Tfp pilus assembly protein PilX